MQKLGRRQFDERDVVRLGRQRVDDSHGAQARERLQPHRALNPSLASPITDRESSQPVQKLGRRQFGERDVVWLGRHRVDDSHGAQEKEGPFCEERTLVGTVKLTEQKKKAPSARSALLSGR